MKKKKSYQSPDMYVRKLNHFNLLQSGSTEELHDGGTLGGNNSKASNSLFLDDTEFEEEEN